VQIKKRSWMFEFLDDAQLAECGLLSADCYRAITLAYAPHKNNQFPSMQGRLLDSLVCVTPEIAASAALPQLLNAQLKGVFYG
jgi:hypothetical protein